MKVLVLIFLTAFAFVQADQIKGTAILFRHGQRTPSLVLPNYGMTSQTQELGFGQLTLTGSQQLYEYGADLRTRYTHLFPNSGYFRANNMRVASSPVPRCVVSVTSFLAGFFPPPASQKVLPIRWQGIPFTQDNEYKTVIVNTDKCPLYVKDLQVAQAAFTTNVTAWMAEDQVVLGRLSTFLGVQLNSLTMLNAAFELLQANRYLDTSLPQWVITDLDNTLKKYTLGYYRTLATTDAAKKVSAGNLITEIVKNLIALRDGTDAARNFLIYSGHDTSLSSLAKLLGVDSQMPDMAFYGDALAIELVQVNGSKGGLEVQVVYVSQKKKTILSVPNCGKSCSLDTFLQVMDKFIVTDWAAVCGA